MAKSTLPSDGASHAPKLAVKMDGKEGRQLNQTSRAPPWGVQEEKKYAATFEITSFKNGGGCWSAWGWGASAAGAGERQIQQSTWLGGRQLNQTTREPPGGVQEEKKYGRGVLQRMGRGHITSFVRFVNACLL